MSTLKGKILAIVLVLVVAAAAYIVGAGHYLVPSTARAGLALYDQNTVTNVYNAANPAVVEIDMMQSSSFFSQASGLGSGIVVDSQGYILTNNHVVDGATSITVKLGNGKSVSATVVGTDAIDDLAVVKVDSTAISGITPLTLGDSSQLQPGQMAIAIGNPYGLDDTVTVGVISGLDRILGNLGGLIQTDAAINPGNSGGPLLVVDSNGQGLVIGINTAIETSPTGAVGIGFAVPSNVATRVLPSLEAGTTVTRPWIGISGVSITSTLAQQLSLPVTSGVYVVSVTANSPASTAGLIGSSVDASGNPGTGGDIITAIDGKSVSSVTDISNYINTSKKVGDAATLTVIRSGNTIQVPVTLGTWPETTTQNGPQIIPQQPYGIPNIPNMPFGNGGRHYRGNSD